MIPAPVAGPKVLPATVLVTGAQGDLGRRTLRALAPVGVVKGLDRAPGCEINADLTEPDHTWRHHLQGTDVLVHLAAQSDPQASRTEVEAANIRVTRALLKAAAAARIRRVVFASSCHVLAGHRFGTGPLTPDTPAFPITAYGWSKQVSEEDGRGWAEATGGSFIALRIGMVLRGGDHLAADAPLSRWTRSKLLTAQDYDQAILRAVTADVAGFQVVTICSAVAGSRWDLGAAQTLLGFRPTPLPAPILGPVRRLAEIRDHALNWLRGGPRRYS